MPSLLAAAGLMMLMPLERAVPPRYATYLRCYATAIDEFAACCLPRHATRWRSVIMRARGGVVCAIITLMLIVYAFDDCCFIAISFMPCL